MNIEEIFFRLRKNEKITKNELYELGADDDYIEFALEREILIQSDDDEYVIGSAKSLLRYGRALVKEGDYKGSNNVFDCAYEADMTDFDVNYQLFYRALNHKKLKRSHIFKHFNVVFDNLIENGREYDANFYVLLLGNLYGSSDRDRENEINPFNRYLSRFIDLEEEDILIPYTDNFSNYENLIRKNVFFNSYHNVNSMIEERFNGNASFDDLVERELLIKWLVRKRDINRLVASYLESNNIDEVKKILDREDERRNLTKSNQYMLKLVNSYLTMKETGIIPTSKYNGDNTFDAIDGNNYALALKLVKERDIRNNDGRESNMQIMLKKIEDLINPKDKKEDINNSDINDDIITKEKQVYDSVKTFPLSQREKQSIDSKIEKMRNGRMIFLLEPMPQEKRDLIREYMSCRGYNSFVSAFSIGVEPERRLVLRYREIVRERIDFGEVLDDAKRYYAIGNSENSKENYENARENFEKAKAKYELTLKIGKPKASTYAGYGMVLYRLGKKNEAVECLRIATILSKTLSDGRIDFTEFIDKIENPVERENRKPKADIKENEFEDKQSSDLPDELIMGIITLIKDGGMKLEDACKEFNLNGETINYIKLIYARDNYYLGNDTVGNLYLKQVERSKEKNKEVKKLYNEIKDNKKYYHNRYDENGNQLVFIKK